jgi:hypothetical protein
MEVSLRHALSYSTKGDVPVPIVAQNLLANERLIHESIRVLGDCFDGLEIQKINVKVAHLSNSSPFKEILAVAVFMTYQNELVKEVPNLIQKLTGQQVPDGMETLVTVLVLITAIYVIDAAVERILPGKDLKRLKDEYRDKLAELSRMTGLDALVIEKSLQKRLSEGKQKSLFKRAYEFFIPAKLEQHVDILIDDRVVISHETISEIPSDVEMAQTEKRNVYELNGVSIEIHRSDIDYSQSGWVAVIEEVSDRRKKMVLPPEIAPADIFGKTKVIGDVSVVEEMQEDGEYVTKEYHLLRLKK